jgi:hypothetical protein
LARELCRKKKIASEKAIKFALRRLEQKRLVIKTIKRKRGAANPFRLTTYGLFMAFYYQRLRPEPEKADKEEFALWEKIDKIATEVHPDKVPLIFGKWEYFKKKNIREQVLESLWSFFAGEHMPDALFYHELKEPEHVSESIGIKIFQRHEEKLVERLTRHVLFPKSTPPLISEEDKWRLVLLGDPDLKAFIRDEIGRREDYHKSDMVKLHLWKDFIEQMEEPNL